MPENARSRSRQIPHPPVTAGLFDMFKIGVGPSSSHTMGPMSAARGFAERLLAAGQEPARLCVTAFGSLAWTGIGHRTDKALILGLCGFRPETFDASVAHDQLEAIDQRKSLPLLGSVDVPFEIKTDLVFDRKAKPIAHPNGMRFKAFDESGATLLAEDWASLGGGSVRCLSDPDQTEADVASLHLFTGTAELLDLSRQTGLTIAEIALENECARRPREEVIAYLDRIAETMFATIEEGLSVTGILPGELKVRRRASQLFDALEADRLANTLSPTRPMDYVAAYAMAVNEVNAAGGQIVTAPTNGAAGIIPAVLRYYQEFCSGANTDGVRTLLLTAAIFGAIIKQRASISGAEVGCQGEVGSAAAMAAAGLCAALGGNSAQVENAAEIALEHHLGLTCDPVGGLVQIPCIERNAFGASKAIAAASLALRGDGAHSVSFDQVVETMRQTGLDMGVRYKETSRGGLASNVTEC